jgi:hypothetical protein
MRFRRSWTLALLALAAVAVPVALAAAGGENPPGSKAQFYGTALNGDDPQNAFNDVVSVDTRGGNYGGLTRKLPNNVKADSLTNELGLKYYLVGRATCGDSPRLSIAIDPDGNSSTDDTVEIYGYSGTGPFGGGCPMNQWVYQDLSQTPSWNVQNLPLCAPQFGETWTQVVTCLNTSYPDHEVTAAYLDDDAAAYSAAYQGCGYYDLVGLGARTYTDHEDAGGKGSNYRNNNCP